VIDLELSPSEFWKMSPEEFWRIYQGKKDRQQTHSHRPTDAEYDEMLELLNESENG